MNDPSWLDIHMDRVQRMVKTHRNHPSIIIWSIGNESGDGPNGKAIYEWTINYDPTRLFHNEGSTSQGNFDAANMYSRMYPLPHQTKEYMKTYNDMPFVLCEYAHAMGNSSGGMEEYIEILYEDNNLIGLFIWDWMDQGLLMPVPEEYKHTARSEHFYAYGGWWEEEKGVHHDGNFCMNGLIDAGQNPYPKLNAVRYVYRNVVAKPEENDVAYMVRMGTQLKIPAEYQYVHWFGKEGETYVDRNFEKTGRYNTTVDELWTDYSRPQENGNISEVRWITFTNEEGMGLRFTGKTLLNAAARYYDHQAMQNANYSFELKKGNHIFVNIDHKQMGVGGDNSWSVTAQPRPPYRLLNRNYEYSYYMPFAVFLPVRRGSNPRPHD